MVVGDLATTTEVIVLGAGPGGYVAALRAAQLGKEVILVDPNPPGGTSLYRGSMPAKILLAAAEPYQRIPELEKMGVNAPAPRLDLARLQQWKNRLIRRLAGNITQRLDHNKVAFVQGKGWFLSHNELHVEAEYGAERYIFDHAVIAVGCTPKAWPGLNFNDETVLMPWQALELTGLPAEIAIVGGGSMAAELATLFIKLGSQTELFIPAGQNWLPEFPVEAGRQVVAGLKRLGVVVHPQVPDPVTATAERKLVVVAAGTVPNTEFLQLAQADIQTDANGFIEVNPQMQTGNQAVYAVGDVTGSPALAHVAIKQGKVAAASLAGRPAQYAPQAVPRVAWTDPQLAAVGLSGPQARAAGYKIVTGQFPLTASSLALILDQSDGFVQIVAEKESEVLLGVTIVGPHAETLIGEAALALEMGATLTDLAETLHPHPGLGESLQEAAEAALGLPLHLKDD